MDRIEFFRRQAESFAKRARECTDPERRVELQRVADGYEYMLGGKAPDDGRDHPEVVR
jgi:hypothetical protein